MGCSTMVNTNNIRLTVAFPERHNQRLGVRDLFQVLHGVTHAERFQHLQDTKVVYLLSARRGAGQALVIGVEIGMAGRRE